MKRPVGKSLLPTTDAEIDEIKELIANDPIEVFERMRDLMAEIMFLTDTIEDEQFESNPEVLEVIDEDYTQMFDLAMSRGLIIEDEGYELEEGQ